MEKVTNWLWRRDQSEPQEEQSYWYDEGVVIIVRGDSDPENSKERLSAGVTMASLTARPYSKLADHSQHLYDFLKARGH